MEFSKPQQEAIDFQDGCCNVIASAGSGKTSVLVNRIVKLIEEHDVLPENILAITFSKKAKDNMFERLKKLIPEYVKFINIETFHSFGFRIIRKFGSKDFEILNYDWRKVKIIEEIVQNYYPDENWNGENIADILNYISIQKNQMKKPNTKTQKGRIYRRYEEYKESHNLIDFDDMLTKCYDLLVSNEKALRYCQNQYQYILADEMQDTNAVQYAIIKLIGAKSKNVFVVDDPLQNIFAWRGSDNRFVMNFDEDWPNARIIHLNTNYRSSQDIVATANHFAECIPESKHRHYVKSVSNKGKFEKPHYTRYSRQEDEAEGVAQKIKDYINNGYEYKDIAILTRTNAQLQCFESALCKNDISYDTVDGASFVDRNEIKIVLSYLRLVCNNDDDDALEYIFNRPNRYLSNSFLQNIKRAARRESMSLYSTMLNMKTATRNQAQAIHSIFAVINTLSNKEYKTVADMIGELRTLLDLDSFVSKDLCENDDSRIENLNALQHMASNYGNISRFIAAMMKFTQRKKKDENSVQLMTIHKSKGLEFPIVFIAGVNQGRLPHEKNTNIDEEKRLMYVAITRAEKILHISSTEMYNGEKSMESEFVSFLF